MAWQQGSPPITWMLSDEHTSQFPIGWSAPEAAFRFRLSRHCRRRRATQTAQGKAMRNAGGESMKTAWLTADEAVLSVR
jgi:hypothetical protein